MRLIGSLVGLVSRLMSPLVGLVSRIPAPVQFKLLVAFLAIAMLLVVVGTVGLNALSDVHQRAEELIKLQRKIEAYRQVQHDTTTQLYSVASALISADERTLSSTLRQLRSGNYRVNFRDGNETTAYYTDKLEDAVNAVVAMARNTKSH